MERHRSEGRQYDPSKNLHGDAIRAASTTVTSLNDTLTLTLEHKPLTEYLGVGTYFSFTDGAYNTFLGREAGAALTTGDHNICIGYNADLSAVDSDNQISMGSNVNCNENNSFVFGNGTSSGLFLTLSIVVRFFLP